MDASISSPVPRLAAHPYVARGLGAVYQSGVHLKNGLYDKEWLRVRRVPVPVISVGGIEAGGSGKTPVAGFILRALCRMGLKPGLATRGYGRQSKGLVLRRKAEAATAAVLGDEPSMLVAQGIDVPVAACAARFHAALALFDAGCNVVVLDDGFSHRRLHRDADIVVVSGNLTLQHRRPVPHGWLREPCAALARAHLVWVHHKDADTQGVPDWLVAGGLPPPVVVSRARWVRPRLVCGSSTSEITDAVAACGLARPEHFFNACERAGIRLLRRVTFADHHRYTRGDSQRLLALGKQSGAKAVLVTEKDAIKLAPLWADELPLYACDYRVGIETNEEALNSLLVRVAMH